MPLKRLLGCANSSIRKTFYSHRSLEALLSILRAPLSLKFQLQQLPEDRASVSEKINCIKCASGRWKRTKWKCCRGRRKINQFVHDVISSHRIVLFDDNFIKKVTSWDLCISENFSFFSKTINLIFISIFQANLCTIIYFVRIHAYSLKADLFNSREKEGVRATLEFSFNSPGYPFTWMRNCASLHNWKFNEIRAQPSTDCKRDGLILTSGDLCRGIYKLHAVSVNIS